MGERTDTSRTDCRRFMEKTVDWSKHRAQFAIIAVAAVVLAIYAIRDAQMSSGSFDPGDLLFVLAIYGVPFLVFAFMVWTGRWSELRSSSAERTSRQKIAFVAEVMGGGRLWNVSVHPAALDAARFA